METSVSQDHADVRILPPLLFLGSLALGVLLQFVFPLRFATQSGWRLPLGLLLVGLGVASMAWVMAGMRRTHQDPNPRTPSPELLVGGPFRFSRNPIYVGMALIQIGLGLCFANAWLLLLVPPTLWILRREVIEKEEAYLTRKFGAAYVAYTKSVRRWL